MKRRRFVVTSGSAVLSTPYVVNKRSKSVDVSFSINRTIEKDPANVGSVGVKFEELLISPYYLDESAESELKVELDLGEYGKQTERVSVSTVNGEEKDISSKIPSIVLDDVGASNAETIFGSVIVYFNHPDLSDSFRRSFSISKKDLLLADSFDDNNFDTNKWSKAIEQGTIEEVGGELHAAAEGTADNARIYSTQTYRPPLSLKAKMTNDPNSETGGYGTVFALYNTETGERAELSYDQYFNRNYWYLLTSDGNNSKQIILDDGSSGVKREYEIRLFENKCQFYINQSKVGEITNNLPSSSLKVRLEATRGSDATSVSDAYWDDLELRRI